MNWEERGPYLSHITYCYLRVKHVLRAYILRFKNDYLIKTSTAHQTLHSRNQSSSLARLSNQSHSHLHSHTLINTSAPLLPLQSSKTLRAHLLRLRIRRRFSFPPLRAIVVLSNIMYKHTYTRIIARRWQS